MEVKKIPSPPRIPFEEPLLVSTPHVENKLEFIPVSVDPIESEEYDAEESETSEERPKFEEAMPKVFEEIPKEKISPKSAAPITNSTSLKRPRSEGPGLIERGTQALQVVRQNLPDPNAGYMAPVWVILALFAKNLLPRLLETTPSSNAFSAPPQESKPPSPSKNTYSLPSTKTDFSMF